MPGSQVVETVAGGLIAGGGRTPTLKPTPQTVSTLKPNPKPETLNPEP